MRRYRMSARWSWTNWTFGVWRFKNRIVTTWGIDIGPLEMYWKKENRRG